MSYSFHPFSKCQMELSFLSTVVLYSLQAAARKEASTPHENRLVDLDTFRKSKLSQCLKKNMTEKIAKSGLAF